MLKKDLSRNCHLAGKYIEKAENMLAKLSSDKVDQSHLNKTLLSLFVIQNLTKIINRNPFTLS